MRDDKSVNSIPISTRSFRSLEFIDRGDTAVITLIGADGREIVVIIPTRAADEMVRAFSERFVGGAD